MPHLQEGPSILHDTRGKGPEDWANRSLDEQRGNRKRGAQYFDIAEDETTSHSKESSEAQSTTKRSKDEARKWEGAGFGRYLPATAEDTSLDDAFNLRDVDAIERKHQGPSHGRVEGASFEATAPAGEINIERVRVFPSPTPSE